MFNKLLQGAASIRSFVAMGRQREHRTMKRRIVVAISLVVSTGFAAEGPKLVHPAAAAAVVDVAARKAALSKVPATEMRNWCWGSMDRARLDPTAMIRGPIRRQKSNAQAAGNALFDNIAAYYAGNRRFSGTHSGHPCQRRADRRLHEARSLFPA